MIGPFRATTHVQMPFCFRSEFRPLDSSQSIFSPSFHPSHIRTEETLLSLMGCSWCWPALWLCCLVVLFCVGCCFGSCSFPINKLCFLFFNDDLGMPRPHGVRTRGKNWLLSYWQPWKAAYPMATTVSGSLTIRSE